MTDSPTYVRTVLAAVVADPDKTRAQKALAHAAGKLHPVDAYFPDKVPRVLFQLLERFSRKYDAVMAADQLEALLRDREPGTAALYTETYASAAALPRPEWPDFLFAVDQLRELAARRATGEALADGRTILDGTLKLEDGTELSGAADAREYLLAALAEAEHLGSEADTPEGNVTVEGDEVMAEYARAKELALSGRPTGVQFGVRSLDKALGGGLGKGVTLVVAGTTVGKSSICVQAAWYSAVCQGRNVLFFTTEQHRTEVRIKFVARHSRDPKFGLGRGLDTAKIRSGHLSAEEEKALDMVLADLKGGGYGRIEVVQMPEHCTVSIMAGRAEALARQAKPDLVVADYLQLFDPERRSRDTKEYESQSGIVKSAHRWAQTAFHGDGVTLISPWQANRSGAAALRSGEFSLDEHMSQTKEAANTASTVLALAPRDSDTSHGRRAPLVVTVEKNRDGARSERVNLTADYANSFFSDREAEDVEQYVGSTEAA